MPEIQEVTPVPENVTAADVLGITKEAFDAAGGALKSIADGEINPDEVAEAEVLLKPAPKVTKVAETPVAEPEPSIGKGWAAVKRAEQEASQMRSQLRKEMAEIKRQREQLTNSSKSQADIIADLKKDPRSIEKYGLSIQEFLDRVITDNAQTPQTVAKAGDEKYAELTKQVGELKSLLMQSQTRTAEEKFRGNCQAVLDTPEYELLKSHPDAQGEMLKFAGAYYQTYGKIDLTPQQIAATLQDTWLEHLKSLSSAKAIRKVFGLPDETVEPESQAPSRKPVAPKAKPKTVTPSMAATPARGTAPQERNVVQSEESMLREAASLVPNDVWEQMG